MPIIVGLTGGIGSGKSTIAQIFVGMGIPVFNSDLKAKHILNNNTEVKELITKEFGAVYFNNKLDSVKLATLVFTDKEALDKLNKIVHPKVKDAFEEWVNQNSSAPILIKEAAILIESGAAKEMDQIISVSAPKNERVRRVIERDGVSETKVLARMANQLSDEERITFSNYIINNDGNELVIPQVVSIINQLKKD